MRTPIPPDRVARSEISQGEVERLVGRAGPAAADLLDVPAMRNFLTLMHERSVSRAAMRRGVSQPAMSRSLARLRQVFGDPLLVASQGGLVPTLRAQSLHGEIAGVIAAIESLVESGQSFDPATDSGTFVVSSSEMFEYLLMPPLLARMQREAPRMRVHFQKPDRTQVESWLAQGRLDFRLAFLPEPGGTLHARTLFEDRWTCVAREGHPLLRGPLTLGQYATLPHVCIDIVGLTTGEQMIDHALARHGLARRHPVRVQSALSALTIVAATDSVATLPSRFVAAAGVRGLQRLDPPLELAPMVCSLYWHERTHRQPGHVWFRHLLADVASGLG